jgi:GNAT superfamily N-acetyltransferase
MYQIFIEGGLIRKLWDVETDAYSDHLLRLDAESRRNRFGGATADDMVRTYASTARGTDVIVHGFFAEDVLRGGAVLRILGREAEAAFSIEKPWQSHGIGSALIDPFANRARADAYGFANGLRRLPACNQFHDPLSTARRQPGILMHVHPVLRDC